MADPIEYREGSNFPGRVGLTVDDSMPAWPVPARAPGDAPNVLFVILDDTGFAQLGCYGAPIRTPTLDRLAANGLLYRNMHTTALCSPTRACVLTGRNHHSSAMGTIGEFATGYPGYNGRIPHEHGFLSEILLRHGYNTFAVGKWHLAPPEHVSAAGPYDRWPLGRGFERFYGFLGAETHQFYPDLVYDNHQVEPPRTPEEGYHLTEDLVDRAIGFIADARQVSPDKPFFLYFCPGATHAPHQVPQEWADRYRGAFDDGWDAYRERVLARQKELGVVPADTELSAHDPDVPEWESLSADERRLYARMMEVYAGFLEHTDRHLGRLIDFLERIGELDDTLVMVLSDNGASAEGGATGSTNHMRFNNNLPPSLGLNLAAIDELGGPGHYNHYPWGWAWAGDTPFRRWKRETYRGGVSDPFIVHWPRGYTARGEVRTQYLHAIDLVPTVLAVVGIEPPGELGGVAQAPIEGTDFAYTFEGPHAPSRHVTQYFEMFAHRAIYHDGWRAVCPWPGPSFAASSGPGTPITAADLARIDREGWELYRVDEDFAECHDLAERYPDVLADLVRRWYAEAGRYNVLPLDGRIVIRLAESRPSPASHRSRYVYYPGTQRVPDNAAVRVYNRSHSITVDVEIPESGAEGVLLRHGGSSGGYVLFVQDGHLHYVHNYVGQQEFHLVSDVPVPAGSVLLGYVFEATGPAALNEGRGTPGRGRLLIGEQPAGEFDIPVTTPILFLLGNGLEVGRNGGSAVSRAYHPPYPFTGTINRIIVDVEGEAPRDLEAEARAQLGRQ